MRYIFVAILLLFGCGSQFYEYPPEPPPFEDCQIGSKHFESLIKESPFPLPFDGRQEVFLYTEKPEFWDEFKGTIHLKSISWNVGWIRELSVIFDGFVVASWSQREWDINSRLDLSPYFVDSTFGNPYRLKFVTELAAKGLKPSKEFIIKVDADFYFCGLNQELMRKL